MFMSASTSRERFQLTDASFLGEYLCPMLSANTVTDIWKKWRSFRAHYCYLEIQLGEYLFHKIPRLL